MPPIAVDHPLLIPVYVYLVLFMTTRFGVFIAELLWPVKDEERPDLTTVINGSLVLLTLLTSLTYYFALTKHDERKECEIAEANAIAKEYFRAGLLPAEGARPLRELIVSYLDQRIAFYTLIDTRQLEENEIETDKLRIEMWQEVESFAKWQSTSSVVAPVVDGMNDVLNTRNSTAAAWKRHVSTPGWSLIILIAMYTCFLTGYGVHKKDSCCIRCCRYLWR